jgi:hypothetical protein
MKSQDSHLQEDQMIRALVDEHDLTTFERNHLLQCSLCQKEKQAFEQALHRLGDIAKEMVPLPRRKCLPVVQGSRRVWRWQPALAAGLAILLLMIGIWWTSPFTRFQGNGSLPLIQKMESGQQLLAGITFLEDDALPARYLAIIGSSPNEDYDDYYDDAFWEFILPL